MAWAPFGAGLRLCATPLLRVAFDPWTLGLRPHRKALRQRASLANIAREKS